MHKVLAKKAQNSLVRLINDKTTINLQNQLKKFNNLLNNIPILSKNDMVLTKLIFYNIHKKNI
jgi:hypothetical protein